MSKCEVGSTWKSKRSYWTLLDPKYCADRDADRAPHRASASVITLMTALVTTSPDLVKGTGGVADAPAAVARFLFDLLAPADEFFLVAFNHKPRAMTGWPRVQAEVQRALAGLQASGGTAIYDAIVESMPLIDARTRARGALL